MTVAASIAVGPGGSTGGGLGSGTVRQPDGTHGKMWTGTSGSTVNGPAASFHSSWQAQIAAMAREMDWDVGGADRQSDGQWWAETAAGAVTETAAGGTNPALDPSSALSSGRTQNPSGVVVPAANRSKGAQGNGLGTLGAQGIPLSSRQLTAAIAESAAPQEPPGVENPAEPGVDKSTKIVASVPAKPSKPAEAQNPASGIPVAFLAIPVAALLPAGPSILPAAPTSSLSGTLNAKAPIREAFDAPGMIGAAQAMKASATRQGLASSSSIIEEIHDETPSFNSNKIDLTNSNSHFSIEPAASEANDLHAPGATRGSALEAGNVTTPAQEPVKSANPTLPGTLQGGAGIAASLAAGVIPLDAHRGLTTQAEAPGQGAGLAGQVLGQTSEIEPVTAPSVAAPVEARGSSAAILEPRRAARGVEAGGSRTHQWRAGGRRDPDGPGDAAGGHDEFRHDAESGLAIGSGIDNLRAGASL